MIKLNGVEIEPTIFPDGTSQVWKLPEDALSYIVKENKCDHRGFPIEDEFIERRHDYSSNIIEWEFENEAELIHIAQLRDLIKYKDGSLVSVILKLDFLPYGRQDKRVSNTTTFARSTFLKILKSLEFNQITTLDVHSRVPDFIENIFPSKEIDFAFDEAKPTLVCFPDTGAKDRYQSYFGNFPTCSMSKDRDQTTGRIKNLFLNELVNIEGESILLVDDICAGGS